MLEVILLTVVIIGAFIATSWYAHQRSQERARAFEKELEIGEAREDESFDERFDALFEKELQSDTVSDDDRYDTRLTDTPEHEPDLFDEPAAKPEASAQTESEPEPVSEEPDWEMVIAFTVMAPEGRAFTGKAVKVALENHDLHFGDMQIFHKYSAASRKQMLFSVANILDPGTLLPDQFVSMTTPGLLVFARLPGPVNGLALYDDMLDTARGMAEQLEGVLCDESRQPVNDEALEATRSKILSHQMAAETENKQFSNDYLN